jgi:hypothetical protein
VLSFRRLVRHVYFRGIDSAIAEALRFTWAVEVGALLLSAAAVACSANPPVRPVSAEPPKPGSEPVYVEPKGRVSTSSETQSSDVIRYRQLSRADFKASSLPVEASPSARKIGAMTCARISTTPETGFVAREVDDPNGPRLEIHFRQLGFVALMDRSCSWWNPSKSLPHDYVLEHEQVHFAITELGARLLDRQAAKIVAEFRARVQTYEEARDIVREKLEGMIEKSMQELIERHRQFDESTSGRYNPEVQRQWIDRLNRELEESSR